ncbi:MAG: protein YhfH [Alicyclobacillaceae bacterium]|nr:protein YhfH [Alicyclobacillaceae bacterium]
MIAVMEFYTNIPKKQCVVCGNEFEEQHESYATECEHCINIIQADE